VPQPDTDSSSLESASVHVAGLRVIRADVTHALELLWHDIARSQAHVFILVNAQSASLRADFPEYAAALEDPRAIGLADGYSVTAGARWFGLGDIGRSPGPDVFTAACTKAAQDGTRIFLLGGGDGVAEQLRAKLVADYPGLQVAGIATPPFGVWPEETSLDLAEQVRASGAQILWLGVSAPKQEIWALRYLEQTGIPTVCVGAAFDFMSGSVNRAPEWMRKQGLEWLHRLFSEPGRLWKRYLVGNVRYLWALARFGTRPPR
jgi:N-acetylglucosaminyldiphosphoundecaprenol N-acetyl-beta-D-mannosaminyltransferase